MTSAASTATPFPQELRATNNAGLKGGGGDDGRRACNYVGCQRHGSSPGGGEGR